MLKHKEHIPSDMTSDYYRFSSESASSLINTGLLDTLILKFNLDNPILKHLTFLTHLYL